MLEEKKATPAIQIFRHRELSQKIAALTEDIEELKSEKALLLNHVGCADDHGMAEVKRRVATLESLLGKLNHREKSCTAELDAVLAQYVELQRQSTDIDTIELDMARQSIRPNRERETAQQLQAVYGKQFDSGMLARSREDVLGLLGETSKPVSVHQKLRQISEQSDKQHHIKRHDQER